MSKNDSTVSKAEQYRKERKARIAKSAKKSAKKNSSGNADSSALVAKIIKVVFAVAVVALVSGLLLNSFGVIDRILPACKIGDVTVSKAEFKLQVQTTYSSIVSMAEQYSQYGMDYLGFDASVPPEDQPFTEDDTMPEDPEEAEGFELDKYDTWMDYIVDQAIQSLNIKYALVAEAEAANFELDDAALKQVDERIKQIENEVNSYNETNEMKRSVNGYLKLVFGNGITVDFYKDILTDEMIATEYQEYKKQQLGESYDDSAIKEIYDKDTVAYDSVDYRFYTVSYTDEKSDDTEAKTLTKDEAKKRADEFISKITDEASFNKIADEYAKADDKENTAYEDPDATLRKGGKSSDLDSMDPDGKIKEWAFAKDRKTGDKKVFELESSYFVIYIVKPAHELFGYDSRHILVKFEGEADQTTGQAATATEEDWKTLKAEADKILKEWQDGEATEESFAALAETYSSDTGSNSNGGLYEHTEPGRFVSEYEEWCLDPARKEGDVAIVKYDDPNNYQGYHIIYFKNVNDKPSWNYTIRAEKADEDYEAYHEDVVDNKYAYSTNGLCDSVRKATRKDISESIRANLQQSASQYSY